jgi:hypothetical protein
MPTSAWIRISCAVLAVAAMAPSAARADDVEAARAEARQLASKGDEAFIIGRCDRAVPLWREADRRFHAPTILVRIARCQALLGKVVAAAATLEAVIEDPISLDGSEAFSVARKQAETDLPSVRARIARLSVTVDAAGVSGQPVITIDDAPSDATMLAIDPGRHHVEVSMGDVRWQDTVQLRDGESRTVRVAFRADRSQPSTPAQRLFGYVLGGVGMATMAVGAGLGFDAVQRSHALLGPCGQDQQHCPPSEQGEIGGIHSEAVASDWTLGSGAALFLGGAVLVVTSPGSVQEAPRVRVVPWGMGARVEGVF